MIWSLPIRIEIPNTDWQVEQGADGINKLMEE